MKGPTHRPGMGAGGKAGGGASSGGGSGGGGTGWGHVAGWYDGLVGERGSEYQREVVIPGVLRMLGKHEAVRQEGNKAIRGRVLDLACGQGVLCRALAGAGYEVVGVDAAAELIEAARRWRGEGAGGRGGDGAKGSGGVLGEPGVTGVRGLPTPPAFGKTLAGEAAGLVGSVRYLVGDATKLALGPWPLAAASFDAVTCVLAVQNMTPLSPVWRGCWELLKPGGKMVVVMMHPCFRVPQHSDWVWEEKKGRQGRVVCTYLTSVQVEIQTHPGRAAHGGGGEATVHFHRPLQAYINTMGGAGLLVEHVEEWASHKRSEAGPRAAEVDRARREVPMFLAVRGRKV